MTSGSKNDTGIAGRVDSFASSSRTGSPLNEGSNGKTAATLYWFRQDLRLHDNPAIAYACQTSLALLPVFVHDDKHFQDTQWSFPRMGEHRRRFQRGALDGLNARLQAAESRLVECAGHPPEVLSALCRHFNITRIVCEEIAAPEEQDDILALRAMGIEVQTVWQSTMLSADTLPWSPAQVPDVFTAFRQGVEKSAIRYEACEADISGLPPLPSPPTGMDANSDANGYANTHAKIHAIPDALARLGDFDAQALKPDELVLPSWDTDQGHAEDSGLDPDWENASFPYPLAGFGGSESDALGYLEDYFQSERPARYKATRNGLSGVDYSTKFSPWLASGALSARRIMQRLTEYESAHGQNDGSYWIWFELMWRDHFRWLHHKYGRRLYRKHGLRIDLRMKDGDRASHDNAASKSDATSTEQTYQMKHLQRWIDGQTGHPFIDAGMRELRATGYLSNRMRQVVASYLIHDLKVDWRAGAAWFESQLIDYDVYSNQGNWLYIAGVGTDPRGGRRFNPDKQAADHDPTGAYQKQWGTR